MPVARAPLVLLLALLVPLLARAAPLFSDAELDALLAAQRWNALAAALNGPATPDDSAQAMRWLQSRLPLGGFAVASLYARNLWVAGNAETDPDAADDLLTTAALIALYAEALVVVDGATCQDRSAAFDEERRWRAASRDMIAMLQTMASPEADQVVADAMALERRTAPRRPPDGFVCRSGVVPPETAAPLREQARAGLATMLSGWVAEAGGGR